MYRRPHAKPPPRRLRSLAINKQRPSSQLLLRVFERPQQLANLALLLCRQRIADVLEDDEPLRRDRLDYAVGQLVALVDEIRLVIRSLDHRDERRSTLHDAANRDLVDRERADAVAVLDRIPHVDTGSRNQAQERITPAGGVVGV